MNRIFFAAIFSMMFMVGCGRNSSQPDSVANGKPVAFIFQHPELVPAVICPDGEQGVIICHFPPGMPSNEQTLCVGAPAVLAHVRHHGDTLGACGSVAPSPSPSASPIASPSPGFNG